MADRCYNCGDRPDDDGFLGCYACWPNVVVRLQIRIKELEQFQQSLHPTELKDYMRTYYVFTDKQIDAAWDQRVYIESRDKPMIPAGELGIRRDGEGWKL
ncbi:hypothetical protein DRQ25_15600 [Candidatus Fermentibacteria bacterium]|nr:MAG: hypothetical protein DRQ25_15600 [Candidatus Fermentibacteria bacterium]